MNRNKTIHHSPACWLVAGFNGVMQLVNFLMLSSLLFHSIEQLKSWSRDMH
uniref:Uncharacterized protein n=1 Tax=Arundo donax TaxID=35708 RepID=A0A0A9BL21_ARUDO